MKKYNYRLVYSTAVIDACKKKITLDMKKAILRRYWMKFLKKRIWFTKSREI